jgi:hypothetical protein
MVMADFPFERTFFSAKQIIKLFLIPFPPAAGNRLLHIMGTELQYGYALKKWINTLNPSLSFLICAILLPKQMKYEKVSLLPGCDHHIISNVCPG